METRELIRRAEQALLTGQPNLATLYMGRARELNHHARMDVAFERVGMSTTRAALAMVQLGYAVKDAAASITLAVAA